MTLCSHSASSVDERLDEVCPFERFTAIRSPNADRQRAMPATRGCGRRHPGVTRPPVRDRDRPDQHTWNPPAVANVAFRLGPFEVVLGHRLGKLPAEYRVRPDTSVPRWWTGFGRSTAGPTRTRISERRCTLWRETSDLPRDTGHHQCFGAGWHEDAPSRGWCSQLAAEAQKLRIPSLSRPGNTAEQFLFRTQSGSQDIL